MRAKIQGSVLLECVVLPDGNGGPICKIIKSLDPVFGLDQEAHQGAPGSGGSVPARKAGQPVAVRGVVNRARLHAPLTTAPAVPA